ncbi:MAG: cell division protein FtsL [Pseudomonadota bacterium]
MASRKQTQGGTRRNGGAAAASRLPAEHRPLELRELLAGAGLLLAVLVLSFAVIQSTHACRHLYAQLQVLEASQWYLQEDYSRLLIQQSTLASHYRVEKVAGEALSMQSPEIEQVRVVQP